MKVYLGSDHGGIDTKDAIKEALTAQAIDFEDLGCDSKDSCDYPEFGHKVAEKVSEDLDNSLGILICGTGIGISMAANRHKGIRAALCHNEFTAQMAREHNNANILALGGRVLEPTEAVKLVKIFLETPFTKEERHQRRIDKIEL